MRAKGKGEKLGWELDNILGDRTAWLLTKKVQMKLMWKTSIISERQGGLGGRFGHPSGGISE